MLHKGIIHVHSNYSYDGQHTLEEIALLAKKRGYSFVGVTEHSDTFDEGRMSDFVKECRRLSDSALVLIPGMEFTCEKNLHLLGLGVEHFTAIKDPILVAQFIKAQGGLAIVAHPIRYNYKIPSGLEAEINGIEIWNAGYDGRFVPNDLSVALWQSLRGRNDAIRAFGGEDLHEITDHCHVKLTVSCDELRRGAILRALKEGNYLITNPYFQLRPADLNGGLHLTAIVWARRAYLIAKAIRHRLAG